MFKPSQRLLSQRLIVVLLLALVSQAVHAAAEDKDQVARRYLRCAAFYLAGANEVSKPELKQQLQHFSNLSLYSAEILMDSDRPRVKEEFHMAREKLREEARSGEVRANPNGFMEYMGEHCAELRHNHPVTFPSKSP